MTHKNVFWPKGVLKRVSRKAYNAVERSRGFNFMTPEQREAAAKNLDKLEAKYLKV